MSIKRYEFIAILTDLWSMIGRDLLTQKHNPTHYLFPSVANPCHIATYQANHHLCLNVLQL